MKSHLIIRLLVLGIFTLVFLGAARASEIKVWYADSLTKILPTDSADSHRIANPELFAARGQHVSVQLELWSKRPLTGVTAEVESLKNASGESLPGASVRPEGYVVVGSPAQDTPAENRVGEPPAWFPDPLLDFPVDVQARHTQSLWISVAVPGEAKPGEYRGTVVIYADRRKLARREFRVNVTAATVPSKRTLLLTNWFRFDEEVSEQFYDLKKFSPGWWTLIDHVAHVMAANRQNMVFTPLMELIQPRIEGNHLSYDFTNFDRWVETFQNAGVIGYIEGSHLLDRGAGWDGGVTVAKIFLIENGKIATQSLSADDLRVKDFFTGFLGALNTHLLEEKGWKSIYYQHVLDEAHGTEPPYYARTAELVHRYMPGVSTMDAVQVNPVPDALRKNCDIWVLELGTFDDQLEVIQQRISSGHPVWFYTCLSPRGLYMNRFLDDPLLNVRLLPWLNFRYGLAGYLHWGWNMWTPNPILDTQPTIGITTLLPPGDAFIVYPDRTGKSVYSSIRLETMTQGIEDYEMLEALKMRNPVEAKRIGEEAISGFTDYIRDPAQFRSIERELLEDLAK